MIHFLLIPLLIVMIFGGGWIIFNDLHNW